MGDVLGEDEYGWVWRKSPTGIEHIERYVSYEHVVEFVGLSWCGIDISEMPFSETVGQTRRCANCIKAAKASGPQYWPLE